MCTTDDKEIIERIKAGETESLGRLLERYSDRVYSLAVRIVGSPEDAEELTQDVFLKVLKSLRTYRAESSFPTWLYRITYNCAVSRLRKRRSDRLVFKEDAYAVFSDEKMAGFLDEDELREERLSALEDALKRLPADESLLVLMFYNEKKSVGELSEITGLSVSNVKVKLHRIRNKLRLLMCPNIER